MNKTIDTKEIDNIIDWLIDNRDNTKAIFFAGRNADGMTTGFVIGNGADMAKSFYTVLKYMPDTADIISVALDRFTKNQKNLETHQKTKEESYE